MVTCKQYEWTYELKAFDIYASSTAEAPPFRKPYYEVVIPNTKLTNFDSVFAELRR
jgi:hypothetical protein